MSAHHHCNAHSGLPRVWLGWGELGNRKAQLQEEQQDYFETHKPDFKLRHPNTGRRSWNVHLDVIRKSTRWIDWRIHKTGDKQKLVLPDLVRVEQIDSLLNFFYTGDYSVEEVDLRDYSIRPCPGGCVTCPQICQLLRIHLAMFQTALLLRITDLQALAFRRFRDLMDTAPAFVLQYAVQAVYSREPIPDGSKNFQITGLKSVKDYRPELVLPAVLRYCGYYRLNPQQITRNGKKVRVFGESEFAELRRKSPKFNGDLALGLWLDTIDITVPTIQFPGNSEPTRSLHPYMQTPLAPQVVDPKRSNYQYVTYLQPLPFKDFNDQRPSNTPTWTPSPQRTSTGTFATPRTSLQRSQARASFNSSSQASVKQTPVIPQLTLEQTEGFNFLSEALLDNTMDQIAAQLPEEYSTGLADLNDIDWTNTMDWSGADVPDIDFSSLLNDDAMGEPTANALDLTQVMNWTGEDLANVDFTQFLNDDTLDLESFDPSCLDLPMDMDLDLTDLNSFDMAGLPDIDFSGLTSQDSMDSAFFTQPRYMDSIFPGMDNYVTIPQEIDFLPESMNSEVVVDSTASGLRAALSAPTPAQQQAARSTFLSAGDKSRASSSSTQTRYNLRTRPSMADVIEGL
ncbi:hypothetical protein N7536_007597 [Penicillium majusculum]|uniref:BTB domain-containing protein n=1 Tax=Penicillium solitum TaxID=60172 RepID=A0A1V6QWF1_9EURO|nr:uncharacterized protein PENSOL_c032G05875 [Penicillium solitum]KAJ5684978.1 hypothetical protein N7536_007597 [Penicillium majusculum]OQD93534.1 hypothetical protein PENSOL_c032G05875 [Penicillium solitum]